jgi:hypothetical protein
MMVECRGVVPVQRPDRIFGVLQANFGGWMKAFDGLHTVGRDGDDREQGVSTRFCPTRLLTRLTGGAPMAVWCR